MRKLTFAEWMAFIGTMTTMASVPWLGPLIHSGLSQASASDVIDNHSSIPPATVAPPDLPKVVDTNPATRGAGPAFDCAKKVTWAETTICDSTDLGILDRQLHREYEITKAGLNDAGRARLRHNEMIWVSHMRVCQSFGDRIDCLQRYYRQRIDEVARLRS